MSRRKPPDERVASTAAVEEQPQTNPSDRAPTIACTRRRELRLSDSVSSRFGDKSANYGHFPAGRDQALKRIRQGRCKEPALGRRWQMPDGSLEPLRCGRSNSCDYCARIAAIEAALVLEIDARICMPTVGITTTTRRPDTSMRELREAEQQLWRALRTGRRIGTRGRRRKDEPRFDAFPNLRYCGFLEFSTGWGTHSGGHRRPHLHHLVKGIPAGHDLLAPIVLEDEDEARSLGKNVGDETNALERRVSDLWRAITGDAFVVECRPLRTPAGAIRYLALHNRKKVQAPPKGFKGRRLRPSKQSKDRPGYYEEPVANLRETAKQLASYGRVVKATKLALGLELGVAFDDEDRDLPDEWEVDAQMSEAIAAALTDMAQHPSELQLDLDGYYTLPAEKEALVQRTLSNVETLRAQNPPELVRVREREAIDEETGLIYRQAVVVLAEDYEDEPFRPRVLT